MIVFVKKIVINLKEYDSYKFISCFDEKNKKNPYFVKIVLNIYG